MDFDDFFSACHRRTVAAVFLVLGNFAEAEDVAQEAYHRASRQWARIRAYDDPEAWVRRVALNLALSNLRRSRRRAALLFRYRAEPRVESAPEEAMDLHRALRRLPPAYRTVLTLRYLLDLTVPQIADELGLPVETVRTRLTRGRRRLATALDDSAGVFDLGVRHEF